MTSGVMASPKPTSIFTRTLTVVMRASSQNPHAAVVLVFPDRADVERVCLKLHSVVFDVQREYLGEHGAQVGFAGITKAEQVNVACRMLSFGGPDREQRRALQHEPRAAGRCSEPIQAAR